MNVDFCIFWIGDVILTCTSQKKKGETDVNREEPTVVALMLM